MGGGMSQAQHQVAVVVGVVAMVAWVALGGLWRAAPRWSRCKDDKGAPAARFEMCCDGGVFWAETVAELEVELASRKGKRLEILDTVRNRKETVEVAQDGSVWEAYGSRHRFHVDERYG